MGAQEQRVFFIMTTLWELSSKADRGARHPADFQLRSSQGDRRSGKDVYTSLKITSSRFAAELSIIIRTAIPQITYVYAWLCVGCWIVYIIYTHDNGHTTIGRFSEQCSV